MLNENTLNYEDIWSIINDFITRKDGKELVKHQIESYDLLLSKYIPETIAENNTLIVTNKISETEKIVYNINFTNPTFGKPLFNKLLPLRR